MRYALRKQYKVVDYAVMKRRMSKKAIESIKDFKDEQRSFDYVHQRSLGLTKIHPTPLPSVKSIAEAKPWNGEEHGFNTSKRMLEDSIKPLKHDVRKRLSSAREKSLDYVLDKDSDTDRGKVLEMSRKKHSVGSGSGLSSGGWIESLADQEIENAMKQGKFDSMARGVGVIDLHNEYNQINPRIDFTEYLLNNIIKKQGGAPPWIMKQQAVTLRIDKFREEISSKLQKRLVSFHLVDKSYKIQDALCQALKNEYTDLEWESHYELYHKTSIHQINDQIRGYNLQAPPTARWGYLNLEDEIKQCYANALVGIENEFHREMGLLKVAKIKKLHSHLPPVEDSSKHYGIKQLIKDLFSSK